MNKTKKDISSKSIKRICLFSAKGSMTVEAAVVLPLFLLFFLVLSSSIEMIRLHGNLSMAMWNVGNDIAFYGALPYELGIIDEEKVTSVSDKSLVEEIAYELSDLVVSYTYIKNRIIDYCGSEYLESSPLTYGTDGLQFIESDIFGEGDVIDITLTYDVSPVFDLGGKIHFRMANRYYAHLWTGYDVNEKKTKKEDSILVYVSDESEVYHMSTTCTYLKLSVRTVPYSEIGSMRNEDGEKYYPCLICGADTKDTVYICDEGNKYHSTRDCYTLIKKYRIMTLASVKGTHRPCSRCGG